MPVNHQVSKLYSTPMSVLPYLCSALFLWFEYLFNSFLCPFLCPFFWLYLSIFIFILWDVLYYFTESTTIRRDADSVNNSTHTARQQISYFLPFYGIILGYFFTLPSSQQKLFFELCNRANIPMVLIILPFFISCIGMLFMPVQISKENCSVSNAQKSILAFTALTQQSVILFLAHLVLRLLAALK